MKNQNVYGLLLILFAGAMNGSFAVPMKWMRRWSWENIWLAWSLIGLICFPLVFASATIPHLADLYRQGNPSVFFWVVSSGAAWGASQVLFGLGLKRVGMALGFAIVIGMAAAAGSLLPLLSIQKIGRAEGIILLVIGVVIILLGVSLCASAGHMRESRAESSTSRPFTGILICLLAGIGGAMINVGMVVGSPLASLAASQGTSTFYQTNAIWLPLLAAGFAATSVYCGWLLTRHGTWSAFIAPGAFSCWMLALLMAVCWYGSVQIYGSATLKLHRLGPVLGWPIFLSTSILAANAWGLASGEWRQAPLRPRRFMLAGVAFLVIAIFLIGFAGQFQIGK